MAEGFARYLARDAHRIYSAGTAPKNDARRLRSTPLRTSVEINTLENNGDRVLREALVEIVNHKEDMFNFIRWKEIYEMPRTPRIEWIPDEIQRYHHPLIE